MLSTITSAIEDTLTSLTIFDPKLVVTVIIVPEVTSSPWTLNISPLLIFFALNSIGFLAVEDEVSTLINLPPTRSSFVTSNNAPSFCSFPRMDKILPLDRDIWQFSVMFVVANVVMAEPSRCCK